MRLLKILISLLASLLAVSVLLVEIVKTDEVRAGNQQPLAELDKMLKQANGVKVDAIVDNKLASNVTKVLNDMATNLRKMFVENRRLNVQVQDLFSRVQNATGVNATNTFGSIQQQASNISALTGHMNVSSLMQRFVS